MGEKGFSFSWRSAEHDFGFSRRSAEHGFGSSWHSAEHGFTLLEMLVALAVFSLAALALLRLEGATLRQTSDLDDKLLAQLVARNLAAETLSDPAPPPIGPSSGEAVNAGRRWRWTRMTMRTPDQRLVRVDISVAGAGPPALLTIVRPAT